MHISDFDYDLPAGLIASEPVRPRDESRMMVVDRSSGTIIDSIFKNIAGFLRRGDVLVINDTRVMRARMYGVLERSTGSTRQIEVLFSNPVSADSWEVMCKPGKRVRAGDRVVFGDGEAVGTFGAPGDDGLRVLTMKGALSIPELLERLGHIPLPPYIERADNNSDTVEYQTMFAQQPGAVAAPTAGLHFTPNVLATLSESGIEVATITLHVGVGTFVPVRADDPRNHRLRPERFSISQESARRINAARTTGNRVIAVGTTSTRTLEYVTAQRGELQSDSGYADMYILPGYQFRAIDGLMTNFHLPRSTLLMLVTAFASRELVFRAYSHAVAQKYRFYSYGDCMLIL